MLNDEDAVTRSTESLSTSSPLSIDESDNTDDNRTHNRCSFTRVIRSLAHPPFPLPSSNRMHDGWCPKYSTYTEGTERDFLPVLANIFSPCNCISVSSLIWAICAVLYRATSDSSYSVVVLSTSCSELTSDSKSTIRQKEDLSGMRDKIDFR